MALPMFLLFREIPYAESTGIIEGIKMSTITLSSWEKKLLQEWMVILEKDKGNTCWFTQQPKRAPKVICKGTCSIVFKLNRIKDEGCPCDVYKESYVLKKARYVLSENENNLR